jgi:hypothetical protein
MTVLGRYGEGILTSRLDEAIERALSGAPAARTR